MRGHIRRRSPDSWTIVVSLGVDPATGKRRRLWRTTHGTRRQAEAELTRLMGEYDRGLAHPITQLKTADYLTDWLTNVVAHRNQPRTVQSYRILVDRHIIPVLGNLPLEHITPRDIESVFSSMRKRGLTENTALHAFSVLRRALRDAERKGLVVQNVCRLVDPPKRAPYKANAPEIDAIVDILAEADSTKYGPILHFMARTGVRRGEAVALHWKNIDLEVEVATIVESAIRVPGQQIMFRPTKSAAGRRGIALDLHTISILRQHRAAQNHSILRLGGAYQDQGLVFSGQLGGPMDLDDLSHQFTRIAARAGHSGITLHGLRHGHAAGLIKTGAHPRVVQERLGHSSAAFTLQVYGHLAKGLQEQAASAFADALDGASG